MAIYGAHELQRSIGAPGPPPSGGQALRALHLTISRDPLERVHDQ